MFSKGVILIVFKIQPACTIVGYACNSSVQKSLLLLINFWLSWILNRIGKVLTLRFDLDNGNLVDAPFSSKSSDSSDGMDSESSSCETIKQTILLFVNLIMKHIQIIILNTQRILYFNYKLFYRYQMTEHERLEIAEQFQDQWNLSNCIGALDGKHIINMPTPK